MNKQDELLKIIIEIQALQLEMLGNLYISQQKGSGNIDVAKTYSKQSVDKAGNFIDRARKVTRNE